MKYKDLSVLENKKCPVCLYIEKEGFPFGYERKRYFIDSEGCFYLGGNNITIKFCPACGRKLDNRNENS